MQNKDILGKVEPFILSEIEKSGEPQVIENVNLSLTYNRFDLAFKIAFLEAIDGNREDDDNQRYEKECYKKHIKAFTLGEFTELGCEHKSTIDDYERTFKDLFYNFKSDGFDDNKSIIPLAIDNSILNGAHRTATAIYLNLPVTCLKTKIQSAHYDYSFFKSRGVDDDTLDYMAQKFIEYSDDCYLAFVWPSAEGYEDEINEIFEKVVYKKNISLNYNGAHNLLVEAYNCEQWLGRAQDNYPGVKSKLVECFPKYNDVRVYLFQSDGLDNVLLLKEKVRSLFGIGKHSIHITDTKFETKNLASLVFNDNSLHFLNNALPSKFLDTHEKINHFKSFLTFNQLNPDDYVLVSGIVMAAYGLRKASDIDYLTVSEIIESENIEHHKKELIYHKRHEEELVKNPNYYFIYKGLKFLALEQLSEMKTVRNEKKDRLDIELIKSVLSDVRWKKLIIRTKYSFVFYKIKITQNLKSKIVHYLKVVRLYSVAKKTIKYIKTL